MSIIFEKVREALPHVAFDQIFGSPIAEKIGGFSGSVAGNVVAGFILLAFTTAIAWFAYYELPGRIKARTIRRAGPSRLNILLARIDGKRGRDIRDLIRAQLDEIFGEVGHWPFAVIEFPITLRETVAGDLSDNVNRVEKRGRKWLRRTNGDILIWGRAHESPGRATINFLLPEDREPEDHSLAVAELRLKSESASVEAPRGMRIYDFIGDPKAFTIEFAQAVAFAAINSVRPIFSSDYVCNLKPERAKQLVERLEPFSTSENEKFPASLLTELRNAYLAASEGLGRQGIQEGWQRALTLLEDNLGKFDRKHDHIGWCRAAELLANAKAAIGEQFGITNMLEQAVLLLLEITDLAQCSAPQYNLTAVQHNLGKILTVLGRREIGLTRLTEAIIAFEREAATLSRDREPTKWSLNQTNLGAALRAFGAREIGVRNLEKAVHYQRNAVDSSNLQSDRIVQSIALANLGDALQTLGIKTNSVEHLKESIQVLRQAFREIDLSKRPILRATMQLQLAQALGCFAQTQPDNTALEESLDLLDSSLKLRTFDRSPIYWVENRYMAAVMLSDLGQQSSDNAILIDAINIFREVLGILGQHEHPYLHLLTFHSLAWALAELGRREGSVRKLEEAIENCEQALQIGDIKKLPLESIRNRLALGAALLYLSRITGDGLRAERAADAFRESLAQSSRKDTPFQWVAAKGNLANSLVVIGIHRRDPQLFEEAIEAYNDVLSILSPVAGSTAWILFKNNLGDAFVELSKLSGDEQNLIAAIDTFRAALAVSEASDNEHLTKTLRRHLKEAEDQLPEDHWRKNPKSSTRKKL